MIKVENVAKAFGTKLAVNDVSFQVERGEVLGFLGPNGAGKSTTMRMITGFYPPSAGRITVSDFDLEMQPEAAKNLIGYLPENAPAYPEMTVQAFLRFVAELHGLSGARRQQAVDRVIEMCFLQPVRRQTIDTLSKGYRHRTCFAQSLLHDPPVLILDEPTDGLDPNQKHEMRNLIKRMGEHKAIILSTHILEEVDAVCSRVVIIDQGKLIFNGSAQELRNRGRDANSVTLRVWGQPGKTIAAKLQQLPEIDRVFVLEDTAEAATLRAFPKRNNGAGFAAKLAAVGRDQSWVIDELHTENGRLEDVFRSMTIAETAAEEVQA